MIVNVLATSSFLCRRLFDVLSLIGPSPCPQAQERFGLSLGPPDGGVDQSCPVPVRPSVDSWSSASFAAARQSHVRPGGAHRPRTSRASDVSCFCFNERVIQNLKNDKVPIPFSGK